MKSAAVIIGVNNCGVLPVLCAAARSAQQIAMWLQSSGSNYEITFLNDAGLTLSEVLVEPKPVTLNDVCDAINHFQLRKVQYDKLIVFFCGHGISLGRDTLFLLSSADEYAHNAIGVELAKNSAKNCGLETTLIFDCCRTPASADPNLHRLTANRIFRDDDPNSKNVDTILSAAKGSPAFEQNLGTQPLTFFTRAFLNSVLSPDPSTLISAPLGATCHVAQSTYRMIDQLQENLTAALKDAGEFRHQEIESEIASGENTYIAQLSPNIAQKYRTQVVQREELNFALAAASRSLGVLERSRNLLDRMRNQQNAYTKDVSIPPKISFPPLTHHTEIYVVVEPRDCIQSVDLEYNSKASVSFVEKEKFTGIFVKNCSPFERLHISCKNGVSSIIPIFSGMNHHIGFSDHGLYWLKAQNNNLTTIDCDEIRGNLDEICNLILLLLTYRRHNISQDTLSDLHKMLIENDQVDPYFFLILAQNLCVRNFTRAATSLRDHLAETLEIKFYELENIYLKEHGSNGATCNSFPLLTSSWHLMSVGGSNTPYNFFKARKLLTNALYTSFYNAHELKFR